MPSTKSDEHPICSGVRRPEVVPATKSSPGTGTIRRRGGVIPRRHDRGPRPSAGARRPLRARSACASFGESARQLEEEVRDDRGGVACRAGDGRRPGTSSARYP